jgi:hypothetical protein
MIACPNSCKILKGNQLQTAISHSPCNRFTPSIVSAQIAHSVSILKVKNQRMIDKKLREEISGWFEIRPWERCGVEGEHIINWAVDCEEMRHEILPHESSDLILNNLYDDVSSMLIVFLITSSSLIKKLLLELKRKI